MTHVAPRCPKHGTVLIVGHGGGDDPWCFPCWNIDSQRLPGPDIEGGCLAMSRFLVWVWCDGLARTIMGNPKWGPGQARRGAVATAVERDLLRLDWSRP